MADAKKGASWLDAETEKKPAILAPSAYRDALHRLWRDGLPAGDKTGWPSLDGHYTVSPGTPS